MLGNIGQITNIFVTIIVGVYFLNRLISEKSAVNNNGEETKKQAEHLNRMRHINLSKPMTESVRPRDFSEIVGQEEGIRSLKAAMCGKNPQHIIIYGPAGVGKTAAARLALDFAKKSDETPFRKNAPFIEADATIMRFDERSIADPLIGSVHDPIYQGAGNLGVQGIPEPKEGAVSKAHGGVLFLDEIGELHPCQMNKLLKVLEDRKVMFESSYYSPEDRKIPLYIHDVFKNGIPADFRLIGATTRKPSEIPEAIRSRCIEIYFNPLNLKDIRDIIANAMRKSGKKFESGVCEYLSLFAISGRDAVKMVEMLINVSELEGNKVVMLKDAQWVVNTGKYKRREDAYKDEKVINISLIKPE